MVVLRAVETWCCRFYSNNSNFIHGGIDGRPEEQQAVTGQAVSICSVYQCLNAVSISITQCVSALCSDCSYTAVFTADIYDSDSV